MLAIVTKSLFMQAIFYSKLKRIMEYKRRVAKQQFNSKGGRVKNVSSFDNQGPAAKKTRREVENDAEHATGIRVIFKYRIISNLTYFVMYSCGY
jgi:hypothetical protein